MFGKHRRGGGDTGRSPRVFLALRVEIRSVPRFLIRPSVGVTGDGVLREHAGFIVKIIPHQQCGLRQNRDGAAVLIGHEKMVVGTFPLFSDT